MFYYCLHQSICPSMSRELSVLGHLLSLNYFIISCKASLPAINSQSVLFGHLIFLSFSILKDSFAGNGPFCHLTAGLLASAFLKLWPIPQLQLCCVLRLLFSRSFQEVFSCFWSCDYYMCGCGSVLSRLEFVKLLGCINQYFSPCKKLSYFKLPIIFENFEFSASLLCSVCRCACIWNIFWGHHFPSRNQWAREICVKAAYAIDKAVCWWSPNVVLSCTHALSLPSHLPLL